MRPFLGVAPIAVCLILFAYRTRFERPLVVAANRDEFHDRPALAAHWWRDAPNIHGGRDLQAQGTWLAVSRDGRLAAVTNWTDKTGANSTARAPRSRGDLPRAFLAGDTSAMAFARAIDGGQYAGFNFIAYDGEALVYASNRTGETRSLPPGTYGLTNTRLGGGWPRDGSAPAGAGQWAKARLGAQALRDIAATATTDELLALLAKPLTPIATNEHAPEHGPEPAHSPAFIRGAEYGTRASTAVLFEGEGAWFVERQYGPFGKPGRRAATAFRFAVKLPTLKETA